MNRFWGFTPNTVVVAPEIEEYRFWENPVAFAAVCAIPTSHAFLLFVPNMRVLTIAHISTHVLST